MQKKDLKLFKTLKFVGKKAFRSWTAKISYLSQSMFFSRNKRNNVYPCKPQFYYIKVGFKGVKIIQACFHNYWPSELKTNKKNVGYRRFAKNVETV